MPGVHAVVLAAGASTRMGTHKLLLPLGGEAIVRRTVREICAGGFDGVLVVVGHEHEQVMAALDGLPVSSAVNVGFAAGMGSWFRIAVEHLEQIGSYHGWRPSRAVVQRSAVKG